ncbi:MAG: hypothetical protein U0359_24155 [Byssovorax sp.]
MSTMDRCPRLAPLATLLLLLPALPAGADEPAPRAAPAPPVTPPPAAALPQWQPQPLFAQPWAKQPYSPTPASFRVTPLVDPDRHSKGAMIAGIVFTGVGVIGLGTGTALALAGRCSTSDRPVINTEDTTGGGATSTANPACLSNAGTAPGMSILLGSALIAGIGVPLWIFGAQRVTRYPDVARAPARPTLLVGPGTAGLRVSF